MMTDDQATFLRPRADSTGAPAAPAAVRPPIEPPPTAVPLPKPAIPPPERNIVLRINPATPLRVGEKYSVTLRGIRNLVGLAAPANAVFEVPKPAARPPE